MLDLVYGFSALLDHFGHSDPPSWLWAPTDNLGTIIAAVLGALVASGVVALSLFYSLEQWRDEANSRRDEAASRRHEDFERRIERFRTPETRAALMMLHNYKRLIPLVDNIEPVTWEEVEVALIPAIYREHGFEPRLIAIRDCFNGLLGGLTNLHFLKNEGLVLDRDVDHIAKELLIRVATNEAKIFRNLRLYILWRKTGILSLFTAYGHDIKALKDADKASLELDLAAGRYGHCTASPWGTL